MPRIATVVCLCLTLAAPAVAQESDHERRLAVARRVVADSFTDEAHRQLIGVLANAVVESMAVQFVASLKRAPTARDRELLAAAIGEAMVEVFPKTAWEEAIAPLYAEHFTAEELVAVLEFNKTPLGRKLIGLQGRLMSDGGELGQSMFGARHDEFMRVAEREIRKRFQP
jgi:hypothetical protein